MKTIDITTAKTAELVAFFNAHAEKPVKKFADRATAEKRVAALIDELKAKEPKVTPTQFTAEGCCPVCGSAEVFVGEAPEGVVINEESMRGCHDCGWFHDDKADHVKNEKRAAGVTASWLKPEVKAARSARHAVEVAGVQYRSVREAFKALGLPDNKHIKFRGDLKKAGEGVFEGHDFKLVTA
jgi:hypothetical protein